MLKDRLIFMDIKDVEKYVEGSYNKRIDVLFSLF